MYHRSVDAAEARCLELAAAGENLGRICEAVAVGRSTARAAARVARLIQAWVDEEVVAGVRVDALPPT